MVERHLNITRDEPLKIVTDTEEENETDREGENFDERKNGAIYMGSENGCGAYVGRVTRPLSCPGESKDLF